MTLPLSGPMALSMIKGEFGGNTPAKLSDYYRKTINSAITANVVSYASEANAIMLSEVGYYPTTITKYSDFCNDIGAIFPEDNGMVGVVNANEIEIVVDPVKGNVMQSQGGTYGGVSQNTWFGHVSYFKINSSDTYTISVNKRLVTTPSNDTANTPVCLVGFCLIDTNYASLTELTYGFSTPLTLGNWVTATATVTGASMLSGNPTAAFGRVFTYDNYYPYVNAVGVGVTKVLNCVVQTSSLTVTSTGTLTGGLGLTRFYDLSNGDVVRVLSGGTWSVVSGATSNSELVGPRQATNPFSKRIFRIGNFFVVDRPQNIKIPVSGEIKFSDFYGSQQSAGPLFLTSTSNPLVATANGNNPLTFSVTAYSLDNLPIRFATRYTRPELTMTGPVNNSVTIDGITYSANTVTFTGNAAYTDIATYPIGFDLDAADVFLTNTLYPYYISLNNPPVWNSPANLGTYGSSLQLSATDPQKQPVAYALANSTTLPAGLSLSATGLISGAPSAAGTFLFSAAASNGPFESYQNFTLITT